MKLHQLEHFLRAAGGITRNREFIVIGSYANLSTLPEGGSHRKSSDPPSARELLYGV